LSDGAGAGVAVPVRSPVRALWIPRHDPSSLMPLASRGAGFWHRISAEPAGGGAQNHPALPDRAGASTVV